MLKLEGITFEYGTRKIFDNLSFEIPEQKYITLVGANGSGKSTLAKILLQLLPLQKGTITRVNHGEIQELEKHDISLILQNPDDQFVRTLVYDEISFGLENLGKEINEISEIITQISYDLKIEHLLKKTVNELSGGEKQKVALASILVMEPKIIILDESLSMLDLFNKRELLDYLKKIQKEKNLTLIHITHDSEVILKSEHVIFFQKIAGRTHVKYNGNVASFLEDEYIQEHMQDIFGLQLYQKLKATNPAQQFFKTPNEFIETLIKNN